MAVKRAREPTRKNTDPPDLSRPERPCAHCGERFQPTLKRRILCALCFGGRVLVIENDGEDLRRKPKGVKDLRHLLPPIMP